MFDLRPVNIMSNNNDITTGGKASISRLEQTIHTYRRLDVPSYSSTPSSTTAYYGREWLNNNNSNNNKLEKKKKKKNIM